MQWATALRFVLDWLSYRSAFLHRLLRTPPARLVRDGRVLTANLRRELMRATS